MLVALRSARERSALYKALQASAATALLDVPFLGAPGDGTGRNRGVGALAPGAAGGGGGDESDASSAAGVVGGGGGAAGARRLGQALAGARHNPLSARARLRRSGLTAAWQRRQISNLEYLLALNAFAGRTCVSITRGARPRDLPVETFLPPSVPQVRRHRAVPGRAVGHRRLRVR